MYYSYTTSQLCTVICIQTRAVLKVGFMFFCILTKIILCVVCILRLYHSSYGPRQHYVFALSVCLSVQAYARARVRAFYDQLLVLWVVSSVLTQETSSQECPRNDLFVSKWDLKPNLSQSLSTPYGYRCVMRPWFNFYFLRSIYRLLLYIVCFPKYSFVASFSLLIFSFENRPTTFPGRMS